MIKLQPVISRAIKSLKLGKFVLIYDADGREEEVDLVVGSQFTTPSHIKVMRKDGGGLIFMMVRSLIARKLQLPYLSDVFHEAGNQYHVLRELISHDIPYDKKSSFSITIDHRKTFTGITDEDRAFTISEFARLVNESDPNVALRLFGERFRSPGSVPICIASNESLQNRLGHSELSTALANLSGITPVLTGCEMLSGNYRALPKEIAIKYAKKRGLVFLEGKNIVDAWSKNRLINASRV